MTNCEPSVKFRCASAEAIRQMVIAGHAALGAIEPLVLAEIVTAGRAAGHFSEAEARHAMIVATMGDGK